MSEKIYVFNPLKSDFSVNCCLDSDEGKTLIIRSMEMESFEPHLADFVKRHLVEKVIFERGLDRRYNQVYKEIEKEISYDPETRT